MTAKSNTAPFRGLSPADWRTIKPPEWVVPGIIRRGYIMLLTGIPGCGKSLFAGGIGLAGASGQGFLNHPPPSHAQSVAYLGLDASQDDYLMFLPRIAASVGAETGRAVGPHYDGVPFQLFFTTRSLDVTKKSVSPPSNVTPEGRDLNGLYDAATTYGPPGLNEFGEIKPDPSIRPPNLLIVDCLRNLHAGEENDSTQMSKVMDRLRGLANKGVAIILIHHEHKYSEHSKGTTYTARGSSVISASVDSHLSLGNSEPKNRSRKIHAKWVKGRGADEFPEFWYRMSWDETAITFTTDVDKPRGDRAWENLEKAGLAVSWNRLQSSISGDSENLAEVALARGWKKMKNEQGKARWYPPAPQDRQLSAGTLIETLDKGGNRGDSAV